MSSAWQPYGRDWPKPALTRRRQRLIGIGKLAVSGISIVVVLHFVSIDKLLANFRQAGAGWYAGAVLVNAAAQGISALRFSFIAEALGAKLGYGKVLRVHFVGLWFNQVLPTGLGGDVVKVALLGRDVGVGRALRTAILDRISGLIFVMFSVAALLLAYQDVLGNLRITIALAVMSVGFLSGVALCSVASVKLEHRPNRSRWLKWLVSLFVDLHRFRHGKSLYRQVWTSLLVHANGIATYFLLAKAVGLAPDVVGLVLLVPLIFLVGLLPISFAGWGIRELGAVAILGWIGIASEHAVTLSVLFGLVMVVTALPGLVLFYCAPRVTQSGTSL